MLEPLCRTLCQTGNNELPYYHILNEMKCVSQQIALPTKMLSYSVIGPFQVLDSPFSRLKDLMVELTEDQKLPIPRAFMRMALSMMKRSVKKRANFNIDDVSPLDIVGQSFIPALFGAAPCQEPD